MKKDVFICHASANKVAIVRPLVNCLENRGFSYWLDELEISVGDSITEKVNDGLKKSEFVIIVLSRAFLAKNCPQRELWAVLNLEAKSGKVIILPILVGTETEVNSIVAEYPLLNDKLFLLWDGDANRVANGIQTTIMVAVHTPTGIIGIVGNSSPILAAPMTCARNRQGEALRARQVSITLANMPSTRVPVSLLVP